MNQLDRVFGRTGLRAACALTLAVASIGLAQAGPLSAFSFSGEGNVLVFDPVAGSGGWNGAITEFSDPAAPVLNPLSLASLVLFDFDAAANRLTGTFEFTDAADLSASIFGTLSGSFTDPAGDLLNGGQLALDYVVQGGSGMFSGSQGFGLSFLTFDPNSLAFNNYSEDGLLVVDAVPAAVPAPATAWLVLLATALALSISRWALPKDDPAADARPA